MFIGYKLKIDEIRERFRKAVGEAKIEKVAYESDITYHTVKNFLNGKKPWLDTLEKVEIWLENNGK